MIRDHEPDTFYVYAWRGFEERWELADRAVDDAMARTLFATRVAQTSVSLRLYHEAELIAERGVNPMEGGLR